MVVSAYVLEAKLKAGEFWQENDYVFCTLHGRRLNPNHVVEEFKKLLTREGANGSAYGIAQSAFAGVRQCLCRAQNARPMSVSYHRTPSLFIDFAISFAINNEVVMQNRNYTGRVAKAATLRA